MLEDAALSVPQGAFLAVVGGSRSGKSTLLRLLCGEEKPTEGTVLVDGQEAAALCGERRRRFLAKLGLLFPDLGLLSDRTVLENVSVRAPLGGAEAAAFAERRARLLRACGLEAKAHSYPRDLSSAETRLVAAVRALLPAPRLLLADEPFQGLDDRSADLLFDLFAEENRSGATVVLSTGDRAAYLRAKAQGGAALSFVELRAGRLHPLGEGAA